MLGSHSVPFLGKGNERDVITACQAAASLASLYRAVGRTCCAPSRSPVSPVLFLLIKSSLQYRLSPYIQPSSSQLDYSYGAVSGRTHVALRRSSYKFLPAATPPAVPVDPGALLCPWSCLPGPPTLPLASQGRRMVASQSSWRPTTLLSSQPTVTKLASSPGQPHCPVHRRSAALVPRYPLCRRYLCSPQERPGTCCLRLVCAPHRRRLLTRLWSSSSAPPHPAAEPPATAPRCTPLHCSHHLTAPL